MPRLCLDLNVWCGAFIARRLGRTDTATTTLAEAVSSGVSAAGAVQLVVSWGMLERLGNVLTRDLGFSEADASMLSGQVAAFAYLGPTLTLGGAGVLPISDAEDRHVLETAWAGSAEVLVTANLDDFVQPDDEAIAPSRLYRSRRGSAELILAHPFAAAAWLREGRWPTLEAIR